jgi:glycosyltransferase involved in cell wall biosynthesis
LAWAKRIDLIITACNELKLPLKIVGTGKEEAYLKSIAGPTIEFMGGVSDAELNSLYDGAKALIFCALDEDFGMVPVEAMAHGVPVIALAQGGVLETVIDGKTGMLFREPSSNDISKTLISFENNRRIWSNDCVRQAQLFSKEIFKKNIMDFVTASMK